jgi:glycosyltransferase involved in cell wall biosynthesis
MKILMTADAVGGVWTYALELCRALRTHELEIIVATLGPAPSQAQRDSMHGLANVRLVHGDWKLEWMEAPWTDVDRAGEWLLEIATRERVDVVHLNAYVHAALAWPCPVLIVAHSCVCSWWEAVHGQSPPAEWNTYRGAVAKGLAAANAVVAPTRAFLDTITRLYGSVARSAVIHNGLEMPQLSRQDREPIIFACGRAWDQAKNLPLLDGIADDLPWDICLAGDRVSPDGRACELQALRSLGALPAQQVHTWMNRAAIFAHPALYEPFGLAVLEAAQRGCALVLSDVPTLRELWDGAALFADPHDAVVFTTHLRRLIDQPAQRADLAQAAISRARQFQSATLASSYRALYRDLATHRGRKELAVA